MSTLVFAMTGATRTHGGIAAANLNVLLALEELMARCGYRLFVLALNEDDGDRPEFLSRHTRFRGFAGRKLPFATALLRLCGSDTLFVVDHVRLALPLAPFLALRQGKCVILAHGSESWRRMKPGSRWLYRHADLCLANSDFTLRHMQESISGFNGAACPLGLSPRYALNEELPPPIEAPLILRCADGVERAIGDRMLLLVGRMDPNEREKGHAQLLNVWGKISARFPDAQLAFVGPGEDHDFYRTLATRLGAGASVFVADYQPVDVLMGLYQSCYAYVMPSRQEGFGLVYLEAMNFGKPCVGCREDGGGDVILDGLTGLLVRDPDDREELEGVLSRLLESRQTAEEMGRRGWERLRERFTARHAQERIMDQVASLI